MERLDRIERAIEELQKSQSKTDKQLAKTDVQLAETDRIVRQTAKQLSNLGINLGHVAEEFFYYSLEKNKKLGNIQFDEIDLNVNVRNRQLQDEFDIVMYNGKCIALIEIKHKVHPNDIEHLMVQKVKNFKLLFPDYADSKIYLGIGGMSIPKAVADEAHKYGIAILRQKGEHAIIEDENLIAY